MFGLGLVWAACKLILRFARVYYDTHKASYSVQQQNALEALFTAAEVTSAAIAPIFAPLP